PAGADRAGRGPRAAGPALRRRHLVPAQAGQYRCDRRPGRAAHDRRGGPRRAGGAGGVVPSSEAGCRSGHPEPRDRRTTDAMTAQARLLGGRYQVGELLGYGGMAEVHKGRDLRLGRDVAIKTLRSDLARDATFQLRFRREAQNAAALNPPAIVAVYDTGEEHGPSGEELPYIVM